MPRLIDDFPFRMQVGLLVVPGHRNIDRAANPLPVQGLDLVAQQIEVQPRVPPDYLRGVIRHPVMADRENRD